MFASFSLSRSLTSSNTVEDKIPDETNDSQVKSISSVQLWSEGGVALIELKCIAVINANWHGCASHGFPRVQEPSIYVSLKSAMQIVGGCWKREIWTQGWNFQNLWAGFKPSRCCQYGGCHQVIFKSHNQIFWKKIFQNQWWWWWWLFSQSLFSKNISESILYGKFTTESDVWAFGVVHYNF